MSTNLTPFALTAKGALIAFLAPRLNTDARIALDPILAGVTAGNYPDKAAGIGVRIRAAVRPHLATDAALDDLPEFLDAIAEIRAPDPAPPRRLAQDAATSKGPAAMPSAYLRRAAGRLLNEYGRGRHSRLAHDAKSGLPRSYDQDPDDDIINQLVELLSKMDPDQVERALNMLRDIEDPEAAGMDQPPPFGGRPTPGGVPLPMREAETRAMQGAQDRAYKRRTANLAQDAAVRSFTAPARGRTPAPSARASAGFNSRFPDVAKIGRL